MIAAGAIAAPFASIAQQHGKAHRIGFLGSANASETASRVQSLRAGLRELGYIEGTNIVIEFRWAEGNYDQLPRLASELVRLNVDVIVTHGTPGTRAARQATAAIPIVMATSGDPVELGFVRSLAQLGGNVTGSTVLSREIMLKRLELLKEGLPHTHRIAVLQNPNNPGNRAGAEAIKTAAKSLNVEIQYFYAQGSDEIERAFLTMAKKRVDAVAIGQDGILIANAKAIGAIASKQRIPVAGFTEIADAGGLIAYGVNIPEMFRRAAYFVDRIFKGARPGDLPIEQPTKFELVINMKTAKALGITIPQSILVWADKVIE